ncbi:hypothetical protein [Bradyrhizobium sp. AZCC 2289]|uniref:hypothetical protein n=1 Tax=Bradyrhizobium sp. AZCC 2289 TaxID=3117026 RepID=UPI002FF40509
MQKREYEAMVARVRQHYGPSIEIGGFNSHDIIQLQKRAAQAETDQAAARAAQPISEAATRLHHTRQRAHRAWQTITEGQATLAKNRRLHAINGVDAELLDPIGMPKWDKDKSPATVADYDAANAEAAELATELEARANKMLSYVSEWERSTPEQQNRSMILALADRLDRLETKRGRIPKYQLLRTRLLQRRRP